MGSQPQSDQGSQSSKAERDLIRLCQADYSIHIRRVQGVEYLAPKQLQIVQLISKYERVAARACHGVGKTFVASRIALAFGTAFPGSQIITTAPTGRLVKELLWAEMRAGWETSTYPLGGEMLTTQWKLGPKWGAIGFSPQKGASTGITPTSFQGFHAPYILIIFDEATGIPPSIWEQVEGMLTNAYVRFLAIGNPTDPTSQFERCFRSPLWRKLKIDCFDSPNLEAAGFRCLEDLVRELSVLKGLSQDQADERLNGYPVIHSALLTAKWVMQRALDWGIDHPLFQSKALAEFPKETEDTLYPLSLVIQSQERWEEKKGHVPKRRGIGVDPARYGPDHTIVTVFEDDRQTQRHDLHGKDTTEVAGFVTNLVRSLPPCPEEAIAVDEGGLGGGVIDMLKENHRAGRFRAVPIGLNFGQSPDMEWELKRDRERWVERYANLKARLYGELKAAMSGSLALQDLAVYQEEMPTLRYSWDSKGRLRVESKDDYKARTGRKSPDDTDSLALANFARTITLPKQNEGPRIWTA